MRLLHPYTDIHGPLMFMDAQPTMVSAWVFLLHPAHRLPAIAPRRSSRWALSLTSQINLALGRFTGSSTVGLQPSADLHRGRPFGAESEPHSDATPDQLVVDEKEYDC